MTSGLYPTEVTYTPAADGEEANTAYAKWKSHADSGLTTFTGNLIIDEEYTLTETAAAPVMSSRRLMTHTEIIQMLIPQLLQIRMEKPPIP